MFRHVAMEWIVKISREGQPRGGHEVAGSLMDRGPAQIQAIHQHLLKSGLRL